MHHTLIGISGQLGSGKSAAADYIATLFERGSVFNNKEYHIKRYSFAGAIKQFCISILGLKSEDVYTPEGKARFNEFWGMTNREILQRIGTEAMRNGFHPDVWTKIVEKKIIDETDPRAVIIIDDVRFRNEAEMIHRHRGVIVNIIRHYDRAEVGIEGHPSEKPLDTDEIDHIILNDGSFDEFYKRLSRFVFSLHGGNVFVG